MNIQDFWLGMILWSVAVAVIIYGNLDFIRRFRGIRVVLADDENKPQFSFGCPHQGAGRHEPYLSWWHIPVTLMNDLTPECSIKLHLLDGDKITKSLDMQWQTRKGHEPSITMKKGETHLVPVVRRSEQDRPSLARITDEAFFVHGRDFTDLQANTEQGHKMEIEIIWKAANSGKQRSPSCFLLVPENNVSNGQFILRRQFIV